MTDVSYWELIDAAAFPCLYTIFKDAPSGWRCWRQESKRCWSACWFRAQIRVSWCQKLDGMKLSILSAKNPRGAKSVLKNWGGDEKEKKKIVSKKNLLCPFLERNLWANKSEAAAQADKHLRPSGSWAERCVYTTLIRIFRRRRQTRLSAVVVCDKFPDWQCDDCPSAGYGPRKRKQPGQNPKWWRRLRQTGGRRHDMHADRNHVNILPARGGRQNLLGVALNRRLRVIKRIVSWNFFLKLF